MKIKLFPLLIGISFAFTFIFSCSNEGVDGKNGTDGTSCAIEVTAGAELVKGDYKIICGNAVVGYLSNGTDGTDGETGEQGPKGDKGDDGLPGTNGADGTDGTDGETGEQGPKGDKGDDGLPGTNGADGTDCSVEATTGEDIINGDLKITCGSDVGYLKNGTNGADGTSCTVRATTNAEKGQGDFAIVCGSLTVGYLKNGTNGSQGTPGTNGSDGASCSVANAADPAYSIMTCANGTSNTWPKAMCGATAYDPSASRFCSGVTLYDKCDGKVYSPESQFCDFRDGKIYKMVKIGGQTWMAENLNYNVLDNATDVCYGNSSYTCATHGRLYNWATAMDLPASCNSQSCASQIASPHRGNCPSGWHVPSNAEWTVLIYFVGGASSAGSKLKAKSGWNNSGNGTDDYGFSALPGGYSSNGSFSELGTLANWWSAREHNSSFAYYYYMFNNSSVTEDVEEEKFFLFYLRCIQN